MKTHWTVLALAVAILACGHPAFAADNNGLIQDANTNAQIRPQQQTGTMAPSAQVNPNLGTAPQANPNLKVQDTKVKGVDQKLGAPIVSDSGKDMSRDKEP